LVPFESLGAVSYSPPIVTMAVPVAVCEIFSVKEWCDLENRVTFRSRSLKTAPFDRSHTSSYWPSIVTMAISPGAGVPQTQLRHFYLTVIPPVLECAAPVWHHLITKTQADQTEAIQKRAIRIIYTCTHDMPYVSAIFVADLPTIADRRDQLSRKFFNSTLQPTSLLHSLLPPPRDQLPITRLRTASKFPRIPIRTKKYQFFLSYALAHQT